MRKRKMHLNQNFVQENVVYQNSLKHLEPQTHLNVVEELTAKV